jgi:hypothetical protein
VCVRVLCLSRRSVTNGITVGRANANSIKRDVSRHSYAVGRVNRRKVHPRRSQPRHCSCVLNTRYNNNNGNKDCARTRLIFSFIAPLRTAGHAYERTRTRSSRASFVRVLHTHYLYIITIIIRVIIIIIIIIVIIIMYIVVVCVGGNRRVPGFFLSNYSPQGVPHGLRVVQIREGEKNRTTCIRVYARAMYASGGKTRWEPTTVVTRTMFVRCRARVNVRGGAYFTQ